MVEESGKRSTIADDPTIWLGANAVHAALVRLHTLGVAIRRSAASSRVHRISSGSSLDAQKELCLRFVKHRFQHAHDGLMRQLGRSIHIRGQSMFYLKRHNKKIATKRTLALSSQLPNRPIRHASNGIDGLSLDSITQLVVASKPISETNASKLDVKALQKHTKHAKPSYSQISKGSSTRGTPDEEFRYPRMPVKNDSTTVVPCPLCSQPLEMKSLTKERWR